MWPSRPNPLTPLAMISFLPGFSSPGKVSSPLVPGLVVDAHQQLVQVGHAVLQLDHQHSLASIPRVRVRPQVDLHLVDGRVHVVLVAGPLVLCWVVRGHQAWRGPVVGPVEHRYRPAPRVVRVAEKHSYVRVVVSTPVAPEDPTRSVVLVDRVHYRQQA